jgi:hypothetical protein
MRTSYVCSKCGNLWMDKVPDYNIIPDLGILSASQVGLIEAGKIFVGARVCDSEQNQILMSMATRHAKYPADHNSQGHQLFQLRVEELYSTLGRYTYAEIAAESWPWETEASMLELGTGMFKSWVQSPGHWGVASKKHKYFGADMAKGSKGLWYACILVGD